VVAWLGPWQFLILVGIIALIVGTARFTRTWRALKAGGKELKRGWKGDDREPPRIDGP
jgi:Sec-independent protein translocase protein TatA